MRINKTFWFGFAAGGIVVAVAFLTYDTMRMTSRVERVAQAVAAPTAPKRHPAEVSRLEAEFRSVLALSADGSRYDPSSLAQVAAQLITKGFPEADAKEAVKRLVDRGVTSDMIERFATVSGTFAKVLNRDLVLTSGALAEATTRGYEACAGLDNELNFLTAAERETIRTEFDAGNAEEARMRCFGALEVRAIRASQ